LTILLKAFLTICLLGFYLLVPYLIFRIGADTLRLYEQMRESFPFLAGTTVVVGTMVATAVFGIATRGVLQAVDGLWTEAPTRGGSADVEMSAVRC
jgi:ATP/ADP translocase